MRKRKMRRKKEERKKKEIKNESRKACWGYSSKASIAWDFKGIRDVTTQL